MLYNAPTGSTDPNAAYVGKNLAAGQAGSKIPPAVPEFTQREIVAAIVEAGMAPTNVDLKQLMRAIRSGQMSVLQDTGTPSAIVVTCLTPHTSLVPGTPFCIKLANDIVGATTITLDSLGTRNVTHLGGGALQRYDYLKNDLLLVRVNATGTGYVVMTPISMAVIDGALTKSVHGVGADFADLNAAFAWLNRRRIAASGTVTFQLAAGVNANKVVYTTDIFFQHPDGQRVTVKGQPLGGLLPDPSVLTCTGNSPSARASDTTVNLALLRNVYATEIAFQGGHTFRGRGALGSLQDLLITSDGIGGVDTFYWVTGSVGFTRCSAVGSASRGFAFTGVSAAITGNCYAFGHSGTGFSVEDGSVISLNTAALLVACSNGANGMLVGSGRLSSFAPGLPQIYARGNTNHGLHLNASSGTVAAASICRDNGGNGFTAEGNATLVADGCVAASNGLAGFAALTESFLSAVNTTGTGNGGFGYAASNSANLVRTGGLCTGTAGSASPAVGVVGNANALIS